MNRRQTNTLKDIFHRPTKAGIKWSAVVSLFKALGAIIKERAGSRVAVRLKQELAILHRPHPKPECSKGLVEAIRDFLKRCGVKP